MTYVDSAILDLTEWSCRKFQLLTGRTNVWFAVQLTNLTIIVYFVWAGVYFWRSDVVARMVGGLLYLLACDPLPPCAGKLREWLRGSAPSRRAASESSSGRGDFFLL